MVKRDFAATWPCYTLRATSADTELSALRTALIALAETWRDTGELAKYECAAEVDALTGTPTPEP